MEIVSNTKYILIDSGALNHMVASKEYFSSLEFQGYISIYMGDDPQISLKGKGTIHLEHGSFQNVLYVPSLDQTCFMCIK